MSVEKPLSFSVVIPTYNSATFIERTLSSVFGQSISADEVIITDDGSADETLALVLQVAKRTPGVRVVICENQHAGPGANRNTGIARAQGDWIAFLDADDEWLKRKLEAVRDHILGNPQVDLWCHSETEVRGDRRTDLLYYSSFDAAVHPFLNLYRRNALSTSAVVARASCLRQADGFDASLPSAQDYDLWLRLAAAGCRVGFIKEVLGIYNIREGNISSRPLKRLECLKRIDRKADGDLRNFSSIYWIDKLRFRGQAYLSCGLVLLSQKRWIPGVVYALVGIIMWPFQKEFYTAFFKRMHRGKKEQGI